MRLFDRVTIIKEGIGIALDAIRSNKIRAGLTIMGVAVGVFAVSMISPIWPPLSSAIATERFQM